MPHAVIFGASSDIAQSFAQILSDKGYDLTLFSRESNRLKPFVQKLAEGKTNKISIVEFDALDTTLFSNHMNSIDGDIDVAFLAFGLLDDNESALGDQNLSNSLLQVNYVAFVLLANMLAIHFKKQGYGALIGISSVAGVRGRKSNFIYGSAKSGVSVYLSGLGSYLKPYNIQVSHVIAGYVNTKMTAHLNLPSILTSTSDQLALRIYKRAVEQRKRTIYSRPVWRLIAFAFRIMPRSILDHLNV